MNIKYNGKKTEIEKGLTVSKALKDEIEKNKYQVVGCLYNNEYRNLETEIENDAQIELIDTSSKEASYVTGQEMIEDGGNVIQECK